MKLIESIKLYIPYFITKILAFYLVVWVKATQETVDARTIPDNIYSKYLNFEALYIFMVSINVIYFIYLFKKNNYLYILHILIVIMLIYFALYGYFKFNPL